MSEHPPEATSANAPQPLIARDVVRRIGDRAILAGIDLEIAPREVVALVGPSGCGKSTLLELVCGLQAPDGGRLAARPAALMPQRDLLLPWLNARDNVALPLRIAGVDRRAARRQAQALLAHVGLEGYATHRPDQLSGGMRQRVSFLRALATDRDLLCLDEPFGALDAITREELQRWLAALLDERPRSVLLVTHDVEEAVLLSDRVVVLSPRPARVVATVAVGDPRGARAREAPGHAGGPLPAVDGSAPSPPDGTTPTRVRRDPTDPTIVAARRAVRDALHAAMTSSPNGGRP